MWRVAEWHEGWVWGGGVPSPVEWGLGRGCAPPQKKRIALRILVYSDNPTYANIMFITACNERENSPQSLYDMRLTVLLCDAMRKRGLCCHPVSVRPSVT